MMEKSKNNKGKEFSDDDLSKISGGFESWDPGIFREQRFRFNDDDARILKKQYKIDVTPGREYCRGDLNDWGIEGSTGPKVIRKLKDMGLTLNC